MKISVDTKEDSHDDIRKVIKMLQNLVGDSQEIFTNQPSESSSTQDTGSAFTSIFGDTSAPSASSVTPSEATNQIQAAEPEEASGSTEDLFAELFSEEELKKMNEAEAKDKEEAEGEIKPKDKKYSIEFY